MKPILLTLLCSTLLAADAMKLPDVEPPKIKLPDGWQKAAEPDKPSFSTFTAYDPAILVMKFSENWTTYDGWMTIHPGETQSWKPEDVLIETKNKPTVTKIGDRWVIRFKP